MIIRRINLLCAAILFLSFLATTPAQAQITVTWSGMSGADWNTAANWSGGAKPTSIDTALFNSNVATVANAVADQTVAGITFDNGAAATTIGATNGKKLLLTSGGTITYAATLTTNSQTINAPLTLLPVDATSAGSYTFTNLKTGTDAANSLKFAGAIAGGTTSNTVTLTLAGVNSANNGNRISGVISDGNATGGVAIVKTGTGRWELTGNNTFTGSVSVNDGVLGISGTALGSTNAGTTVASGATLAIIGNSLAAEPVTLQGTGFGGTLGALSGGGVSFGGLLTLANDATIKGSSPGNNVFSLTNTGTITGAGRTLTLDGNGQAISVSSVIGTGAGNVVITGLAGNSSNTITLAGISTYSGTTFVQNGTLTLGASGDATYSPLGTADAGTVVSNGAKLNLGGRSITTAESLTLNGVGFGNEGVLGGTGTWSGPIILATNSQIGGIGASSNVTIATSSTISGAGALTLAAASGGGRIDGTLSMGGSLSKSNSGTWTLSGSNTFAGAASVSGGVLRIAHSSALGTTAGATTVSSGAGLEIDGSGGDLTAIAEALTLTGSGVSGYGVLRNIAGNNTITGNITASTTGPRINSDSGTLTLSSAGTYSSGNLLLSVGGSGNVTIDRIINSTQGVTKDGSGVLAMSRLNTYGGVTTVAGGVVAVSEIANGGAASGLGNSSSAAANLVIDGGTLRYIGTGGSSNRNFTTGTNGATIDASGSGALTLSGSSAFVVSNTAAALTFTGTSTADNTFSGILGDNGTGATSLTKTGAGKWILSGGNTYTGSTSITSGVLALGASNVFSDSTAVTVSGGELSLGSSTDTVSSFAITSGSLTGSGKLTASTYGLGGGTITGNLGGGTLNVTANSTLNGTSDANTVNLNAGALALGGASRFTSSSVAVSGSAGAVLTLGGNEALASLAGAANIALGAGTLTIGSANSSTTYSGNLSGLGILAKLGSGTFTVSGNNSHSGGTQIANGTLRLGSDTALPASSAVTLGTGSTSGVLEFSSNTATLGSITFNGSGSQLGTGTGGKLNLLASGTNNATITVTSGSHILHPDTSLQSNTVIDVNAGAIFTLHGVIDGAKSLTKLGSGTLAISGNNSSFSGGSYLNGGYVNALNSGALGSGTVTIDGNTILNLNNTIFSNAVVFGSGSGAIINAGSAVNVSGTYSVTSGTGTSITTNYNVQSGGDISFANNLASTVEVQNGAVGTFTADVLGGGGVTVYAGGRGLFSGNVAGPVTTSGSAGFSGSVLGVVTVGGGTATLAGPTDAASSVNVNAGLGVFTGTIGGIAHATASGATIEIRSRVLSTADVNAEAGATVKLMGSEAFDGTTIDNDGLVVVNRTANLTLGAVISGSGSLTKSDATALTLTGNNTYSGLTTISGGTLSVGNGGTSGALAGNVVNNAALVFNRSDNSIYAGNISGSGGFTKLGAGKLSLTGSSSYSGGTTVEGGILAVNGQIGGNATVLAGGTLGGSGSIAGVLSGAGLVGPGNSPGILTASQFDPSGGLDAAFEFTALAPVYTSATASLNDVLRLTNLSNPFASGTFAAGNVIDIYFNVGSIASGQIYEGGFFTGLSTEGLLAALDGKATFNYWAKTTGTAERTYGGFNYVSLTSLSGITGVTFKTASRTANFGNGDVTGSVTQFVIIPEPDTIVFAGIGIAMAGWSVWKRRRIAQMLRK